MLLSLIFSYNFCPDSLTVPPGDIDFRIFGPLVLCKNKTLHKDPNFSTFLLTPFVLNLTVAPSDIKKRFHLFKGSKTLQTRQFSADDGNRHGSLIASELRFTFSDITTRGLYSDAQRWRRRPTDQPTD